MDLKGIMLRAKRQRKTYMISLTYMWNLKKLNSQTQSRNGGCQGCGEEEAWGSGEMLVKEYKFPLTR